MKDHKFKLRNADLYEDTQGWVRVLHECKFEQQFSAFHEMFMQWLDKMQEFEWKAWWEKYWANKRFSLCHLKYLHVSANNNCERSFRTMKEDLGNVQLGFIRQNHRAQQMLRTLSKTQRPFRTLPNEADVLAAYSQAHLYVMDGRHHLMFTGSQGRVFVCSTPLWLELGGDTWQEKKTALTESGWFEAFKTFCFKPAEVAKWSPPPTWESLYSWIAGYTAPAPLRNSCGASENCCSKYTAPTPARDVCGPADECCSRYTCIAR